MDALKVEKETAEETAVTKYELKKAVEYNGQLITELNFDFDSLTGADAIAIEDELLTLGKTVAIPAFSGEYLIRMAAKACKENVGSDLFLVMNLHDHNKIKSMARSFLLRSE